MSQDLVPYVRFENGSIASYECLGGSFQWAAVIVTHGSSKVVILNNVVKNAFVGISIGEAGVILFIIESHSL